MKLEQLYQCCRRGNRLFVLSVSFLLTTCAPFLITGCLLPFPQFYPVTLDASGFLTFAFRNEPCLESISFPVGSVCEATIERDASGEYIVSLDALSDDGELVAIDGRTLNQAEIAELQAIFDGLRIDPYPGPFCEDPFLGDVIGESFFRWDNRDFIMNGCDQARINPHQALQIIRVLDSLVPRE